MPEKVINQEEAMRAGMLEIATMNSVIEEAAKLPTPVDLFKGLVHEGEVACLFADTNLGKSVLAMQMAEEIALQRRVLYVDCEQSPQQTHQRYTNMETMVSHVFPENLFRASISAGCIEGTLENYERMIMRDIENAALRVDADVVIIDNLTYLCLASEQGDAAAQLMIRLLSLKRRHGWTVLVIAHTPKRQQWSSLSINDLAGSKKLANFFDTIFAIGKGRSSEKARYIKQLKVRTGEFLYTDKNVLVCELTKVDDTILRFVFKETGVENRLLFEDAEEDEEMKAAIQTLLEEGRSIREIAEALGCSKSSIGRMVKQLKEKGGILNEKPKSILMLLLSQRPHHRGLGHRDS